MLTFFSYLAQLLQRWCNEMARALKSIHDAKTIHRDLKTGD